MINLALILFLKAMGAVEMILFDCAKEYGLTENALQVVVTAKDVAKIDPCYWGCALKKTEFVSTYHLFPVSR